MGKPPVVITGSVAVNGVHLGCPTSPEQIASSSLMAGAGTGVDFDRDAFAALIADKGYEVIWEKASLCPNRPRGGPHPLAHDVNCRVCDGTGFVFFGSVCTQMLIQAVRLTQQFYSQGRWDIGNILVTTLPGFALGYWDRITLENGIARFTELIRRQPSGVDYPKYTPLAIEYVAWVDRTGALQSSTAEVVSLNGNGTLSWVGAQPDTNSYYTISYTYHPRYVIQELLHQHRESTIVGEHYPFPTQAVARADFLVRDESRDAPLVNDADPFEIR